MTSSGLFRPLHAIEESRLPINVELPPLAQAFWRTAIAKLFQAVTRLRLNDPVLNGAIGSFHTLSAANAAARACWSCSSHAAVGTPRACLKRPNLVLQVRNRSDWREGGVVSTPRFGAQTGRSVSVGQPSFQTALGWLFDPAPFIPFGEQPFG